MLLYLKLKKLANYYKRKEVLLKIKKITFIKKLENLKYTIKIFNFNFLPLANINTTILFIFLLFKFLFNLG